MSKVFTGSKARLLIGGTAIAYASSINVTQENTLTDIDVLDQLEVAELAETGHKVSFSVNVFKVNTQSAKALGFEPESLDAILGQGSFVMQILNTVGIPNEAGESETGPTVVPRVIYEIEGAKFEGGSGSVDARGVWTGTWNFRGIKRADGGSSSL